MSGLKKTKQPTTAPKNQKSNQTKPNHPPKTPQNPCIFTNKKHDILEKIKPLGTRFGKQTNK